MISIDSKIEIYLYGGSTDMRKGIQGLAMLIEEGRLKFQMRHK